MYIANTTERQSQQGTDTQYVIPCDKNKQRESGRGGGGAAEKLRVEERASGQNSNAVINVSTRSAITNIPINNLVIQ